MEGNPTKIKFDRQFSTETTRKYSCASVHWKTFVDNIKELYGRVLEIHRKWVSNLASSFCCFIFKIFRPTITIENGKSEEKVVPVNQVRPIKKESKKSEEKNNLEVVAVDYRRHKSVDHKREKSADKHKTDHTKNNGAIKKEIKTKDSKEQEKRTEDKGKRRRTHSGSASRKKIVDDEVFEEGTSKTNISKNTKSKDKKEVVDQKESHDKKDHNKKPSSHKPEARTRKTSSTDKKLVKSIAICDELDSEHPDHISVDMLHSKDEVNQSYLLNANGNQFVTVDRSSLIVKPPNILVYADSFVAKENVKAALLSILNRDK